MKRIKLWTAVFSFVLVGFVSLGCKKSGKDDSPPTPRTEVPDAFVGTFYNGEVSNTNLYNPNNGSWSNAVGSGLAYTFHKDGTFEIGYRNYVMVGTCSNVGMVYRRGTIEVEGNQLKLHDNYVKIMETHSCNPSSNYNKNGTKETETIIAQVAVDQFGNPGLNLRWPNTGFSFFIKK